MSAVRGTITENASSSGTLTQKPFFPKYEVELDSHRKAIPYPGKEHIERVLEEYSHQVKDLQKRLSEVSCIPCLLAASTIRPRRHVVLKSNVTLLKESISSTERRSPFLLS